MNFLRVDCQNKRVQQTIKNALDESLTTPVRTKGDYVVYVPHDVLLSDFVKMIQDADPAIHFCCDKGGVYARGIALVQPQTV